MNEMNDKIKIKDPIIEKWVSNFKENFKNNEFTKENARPLMFLYNNRFYWNMPIVLVASGPSLDKNIKILKKFEKNAIILSADVALFKLVENDIIPDFVVTIDPSDMFVRFWEDVKTDESILICPTTIHPKSLESWRGKKFFFNQSDLKDTEKGKVLYEITKPTKGYGFIYNRFFIGATMLQVSTIFNPKPAILMGYDFAYTNNKAYCDGFLDRKIYDDTTEIGTQEHQNIINVLKEQEIKSDTELKDIYGHPIKTNKTYVFYRNSFLQLIHQVLKIKHIVNATEGGILAGVPNMSLEKCMEEYCKEEIQRRNVFALPKKKRKKRK